MLHNGRPSGFVLVRFGNCGSPDAILLADVAANFVETILGEWHSVADDQSRHLELIGEDT